MRIIIFIALVVIVFVTCRSCDVEDDTDRKVREYVKTKQSFVREPIDADWTCDKTKCSIVLNYGKVMIGRVLECSTNRCVEVQVLATKEHK